MMSKVKGKQILIIDSQDYWRRLSARALEEAGFRVSTLDHYNYPPTTNQTQAEKPDLVILGCANIEPKELKLIERLLLDKYHLLVLCTSLPRQVMRSLFVKGADDVAEKPYDSTDLVDTVNQVFEAIAPANSYSAVELGDLP
jgi:DNA-binding NtrC family response regulator